MGSKAWHRILAPILLLLPTWNVTACTRQALITLENAPPIASQSRTEPAEAIDVKALSSAGYEARPKKSRLSGDTNQRDLVVPVPKRRALLVGINDYDYAVDELPGSDHSADSLSSRKEWPDLEGALNDVDAVGDVLKERFDFESEGIKVLLDSEATREAILRQIDKFLIEPSQPGDTIFFYFAGHGSYLPNPFSDDADKLDETLVPYDSKFGTEDIRDKELRSRFNEVLDRGAALTVVLDSCHSGSAARGYPIDGQARGIAPMRVPLAELKSVPGELGPVPAKRGALVWSAAEEDRYAYETEDEHGRPHGAFTLAWLRAIRDTGNRVESANYLFRRTRGWLLSEARYQEPMLAGRPEVQQKPLFGDSTVQSEGADVIAIERRLGDGRIELQGGWAQGLGVGSRLRIWDPEEETSDAAADHFEIVEVLGWARSIAKPLLSNQPAIRSVPEGTSPSFTSGTLLETTNWVAPRGRPLRVWLPTTQKSNAAARLAREIYHRVQDIGWTWVNDPTEQTPTQVLRWMDERWQLVDRHGETQPLGRSPSVEQILAALRPKASGALFVHLPAPAALVDRFDFGTETENNIVESVPEPGLHHYLLAGRWSGRRVEYAWLRAGVISQSEVDAEELFLPSRGPWMAWSEAIFPDDPSFVSAFHQENRLLKFARIHTWHTLRSPSGDRFPYTLSIRSATTGEDIGGSALVDGQEYGLALIRSPGTGGKFTTRRYVYVFAIDSKGNGVLLFPDPFDPQENHLPLLQSGETQYNMASPDEIQLGKRILRASAPHGTDSFFLLTSAEPITNPLAVFEFEGVRRGPPQFVSKNPLEQLLLTTSSTHRGARRITTGRWSLDLYRHEVLSAVEVRR